MNHGGTVDPLVPDHERDPTGTQAFVLKDLEILRKERDLLKKEARRLAAEVVRLQKGHWQLIATQDFLLRQLDKQRRKRERLRKSLSWQLTRPLRLVGNVVDRYARRARQARKPDAPAVRTTSLAIRPQLGLGGGQAEHLVVDVALSGPVAVVVHAFYPELMPQILDALLAARFKFDLFVTCPDHALADVRWHLERFALADSAVRVMPNRGRDIAPFVKLLPEIVARGYGIVLKLHTKRSLHREDGDLLRNSLLEALLNPTAAQAAIAVLGGPDEIGIVGPGEQILSLERYSAANLDRIRTLAVAIGGDAGPRPYSQFIAGSMFFARTNALAPLLRLSLDETDFEPEIGQIDGTLAHAIERLFVRSAEVAGYRLAAIDCGRHIVALPFPSNETLLRHEQ